MRAYFLLPALIGAFALLAAVACSSSEEQAASSAATTPASTKTISLEQKDFSFSQTDLSAPAGETVTIKVQNNGKVAHTFTIDELSVDKTVNPGQEEDITVTPKENGEFTFYCRFHTAQMHGSFKVSADGGSPSGSAGSSPTPTASASSGGGGGYGY